MTVFYCSRCGAQLTEDLVALPAVPEEPERARKQIVAPSTVPSGHYAVETEPWGAPYDLSAEPVAAMPRMPALGRREGWLTSAGPAGTVVVNPGDVPSLEEVVVPDDVGCCGVTGMHGPNRSCRCGSRLGTLAADCMGPYELHLDPLRVYGYDGD